MAGACAAEGGYLAVDGSVIVGETPEQAEARIRAAKLHAALRVAPDVAMQLRAAAIPSDGRTEPGVVFPVERTPLVTGYADAANDLLVVLQSWVDAFAAGLGAEAPQAVTWWNLQTARASEVRAGRSADGADPLGFQAGTTPEQAHMAVTKLAAWLLWHSGELEGLPGWWDYAAEVPALVYRLRWAAGMVSPRRPVVEWSTRPCVRCQRDEVRVEFFGEPLHAAEARGENLLDAANGIAIRCGFCGTVYDATPAQIGAWLSGLFTRQRGPVVERERREALVFAEWWSVTDAAFMLGVSKGTVAKWVANGLPAEDVLGEDGQVRTMVNAEAARARRWPA